MDVDSIRAFCLAFPNATEKLQWGDELCFKVGGKIFVMLGLDTLRICFKCTSTIFSELIEREDMRPAPYVGRYKWVMLDRLDAAGDEELQDLIRQSFEMVSARVPKRKAIRKARKKRVRSRARGAATTSRKKRRR
jgi:predicted DNA-binding protein (MmcQ/YjbR family)